MKTRQALFVRVVLLTVLGLPLGATAVRAETTLTDVLQASTQVANEMEHRRLIPQEVRIGQRSVNAATYLCAAAQALIAVSERSPFEIDALPTKRLPLEPYVNDKESRPTPEVYLDPLSTTETVFLAKRQITTLCEKSAVANPAYELRGGRARLPDVIHHIASALRFYEYYRHLPRHSRLTVISAKNLFPWETPSGYEQYTSVISGGVSRVSNLSYYGLPAHYFEAFSRAGDLVGDVESGNQTELQCAAGRRCYGEKQRMYLNGTDRYWFVPPFEHKARMSGLEGMRYTDGNSALHNPKTNTLLRALGLPGTEWRLFIPEKGWVNTDNHLHFGVEVHPVPPNRQAHVICSVEDAFALDVCDCKKVPHLSFHPDKEEPLEHGQCEESDLLDSICSGETSEFKGKVPYYEPPFDIPWEATGDPPHEGYVRLPRRNAASVEAVAAMIGRRGGPSTTDNSIWLNFEDALRYGPDFIVSRALAGGFSTLIVTLKTTRGHVLFPAPPGEEREYWDSREISSRYVEAVRLLIETARDRGLRVFGAYATLQDAMVAEPWQTKLSGTDRLHTHVSPCHKQYASWLEKGLESMLDTYPLDGVVLGQLFWGDVRPAAEFDIERHGCNASQPRWQARALTELAGRLIGAVREKDAELAVWLAGYPQWQYDSGGHYSGEQDFGALAELADGWLAIFSDAGYLLQDPDPVAAELERLQGILDELDKSEFELSASVYLADEWTFPPAFYDGLAREMGRSGVGLSLHSPISADGDFRHRKEWDNGVAFTRSQWMKIGDMTPPGVTKTVLVLDRSGSMLADDKIDAAHVAGQLYVDLIPDADLLGVVSFANDAPKEHNRPLAQVTSDDVRTRVKKFLGGIRPPDSSPMTSIGDGLERARQMLTQSDAGRRVIVLLSDGLENQPLYWDRPGQPGVRDAILDADPAITIHTVALGKDADQGLLQRIAADTGGIYEYVYVGSSLSLRSRLAETYGRIHAAVYGQDQLHFEGATLKGGGTVTRRVVVPAETRNLSIRVGWPLASRPLEATVRDPSGAEVANGLTRRNDPRHVVFEVAEPRPGSWTIELAPIRGASEYVLMVFGDTELWHRFELEPVAIPASGTASRLRARLKVRDARWQISGLQVSATVELPDHSREPVESLDRDANGDIVLEHRVLQGGTHRVSWRATGIDHSGTTIVHEGRDTVFYGYPLDRDRDGMRDAWEDRCGLDTQSDDSGADPDQDGLTNLWEHSHQSDPHNPDTDGDGVDDGEEHRAGTNPTEAKRGRLSLSLHLGATQPVGSFNRRFDGDDLTELDLEYALSRRLTLNSVIGRYRFRPGQNVNGATLYLRGYFPLRGYRLFAEAGPGWYDPDPLDSGFGLSAGVGVDAALGGRWRGELGVSYVELLTGADVRFLAAKAGLKLGL